MVTRPARRPFVLVRAKLPPRRTRAQVHAIGVEAVRVELARPVAEDARRAVGMMRFPQDF